MGTSWWTFTAAAAIASIDRPAAGATQFWHGFALWIDYLVAKHWVRPPTFRETFHRPDIGYRVSVGVWDSGRGFGDEQAAAGDGVLELRPHAGAF